MSAMAPAARDIARALPSLASPPIVYQRLTALLERPDWTTGRVAEIVEADPGLTARVLRLANSPVYWVPRQVYSIEDAVQIIGLTELRNLVLVTTVIENFRGIPSDLLSLRHFWLRAVHCASAASALAEADRPADTRALFVAGLLHDVGSIVCCQVVPEQVRAALVHGRDDGDEPPPSVECRVTGQRTAAVGAALLDQWRLPAPIVDAVAWHPDPAGEGGRNAATIHLAMHFAWALDQSGRDAEALVSVEHPAWTLAELDPQVSAGVFERVNRAAGELAYLFNIARL